MYCPNCGNQISEDAVFCGRCGHQMSQASATPSGSRRRGLIAVLIYGLVVVIALAAAGYFLLPRFFQSDVIQDPSQNSGDELTAVAEINETTMPTQTMAPTKITTLTATEAPTLPPTQTPAPSKTQPPTLSPTPFPTITSTPRPTLTSTPLPTLDPGPETLVIGRSVGDAPIEAVRFGNGPQNIIFIGGLHAGFAPGTVSLAQRVVEYLTQNLDTIPGNLTVYVIPSASPDTPVAPGELRGRLNANGVDLNRNWGCDWVQDARWRGNIVRGSGGPAPFSELETQHLRDFILEKQPAAVIFWEARAENGLVSPGDCGRRSQVSGMLAAVYGLAAGYQISDFEELTNQVINGDGANWLDQQGIPAVAVLLPQYASIDWENNLEGILAVLQLYAE